MLLLKGLNIFVLMTLAVLAVSAKKRKSFENLQQLQHIQDSMNEKINPCDDFYGYACGNWSTNHLGNDYMNITTLLERKFESMVDKFIAERYDEQLVIAKENQTFIEKAVSYYYSCRKRKDFTNLPYFEIIKPGKNLEWPLVRDLQKKNEVTSNTNESDTEALNFITLLGDLFSYGSNNVLINLKMNRLKNGTLRIELGMPEPDDFDSNHIEQFLNDFEVNEELSLKFMDDVKEMRQLWLKAYDEHLESAEEMFSRDQLKLTYPQLVLFLESAVPHRLRFYDIVVLHQPYYIRYLLRELWQPLDMEKLLNYLHVQFHRYLADSRISQCNRAVLKRMHLAVHFLYSQEIFQPEALENINAITELAHRIYKHLLKILEENNLKLPAKQLRVLKEKIGNFNINIGNLPDIIDPSHVDKFYGQLTDFDVNNFFHNDLQLLKHRVWEQVHCPASMKCSPVSSITNFPAEQLIVIPFATFIPPIYCLHFHPLLSMSLMGTLLAHEFSHSIDPEYLALEMPFENILSHHQVRESLHCMANQKPIDFLGGLVADLLGARTAYRAYQHDYRAKQPYFTVIPWQQLFFQNLAQYFCRETYGAAEERQRNVVRLNHIVMNLDEFAEAFSCPVGSKMNPAKKCRFY